METYYLELKNISKVFGKVVANDHINFHVKKGEIHALLGENGAGKTTLMNILYGLQKPTDGQIFFNGKEVNITSPREATLMGIGMVHQHFMLIPELSVVENLVLGMKSDREPFLDLNKASKKIIELSESYGLDINPRAKVQNLPVGSQQRVEIVKALFRGAELLILDEPTAVLTPQEVKQLEKIINKLAAQDKTIIFITHKLEEAKSLAKKITILRDGKSIASVDAGLYSKEKIAQMMVGRLIMDDLARAPFNPGRTALKVSNVSFHGEHIRESLHNVSLEIREGEILAIAGVDGNGQTELVEVITGLRKAHEGSIMFYQKNVTGESIQQRMEAGMAHIPQDRQKEGMALSMTLSDNMILDTHDNAPYSRKGWLNYKIIDEFTDRMIKEYNIKAPNHAVLGKNLSGGNQQKVVLSRELSRNPKILIAAQPTRGLDIAAVEFVHLKLLEARDAGMAILLVSTELDECFALCDNLAIMFQGKIVGTMHRDKLNLEKVGLMIAGAYKPEDAINGNDNDTSQIE